MRKLYILILLLLVINVNLVAQKEAANWVFKQTGITWNTTRTMDAPGIFGTPNKKLYGLPTVFHSGITGENTSAGGFTLSDKDGNLLAYSDGRTLWDRNDVKRGDILGGDIIGLQGGAATPYPGQAKKFVILTQGPYNSNNLGYYIFDLNLNEGYGGLNGTRTSLTGIPENTTTGGALTVVRHANTRDYWVVSPSRGTSATYLNVWLITPDGVQTTPTTTYLIPGLIVNKPAQFTGQIKFSADGKYFAWGTNSQGSQLAFGKFDNATGTFSNVKWIKDSTPGAVSNFRGIEFSRSAKYLYTVGNSGSDSDLVVNNSIHSIQVWDFQELLAAPSPSMDYKKNSFDFMPVDNFTQLSSMQMGPDGRIYISQSASREIIFIENPEAFPSQLEVYRIPEFYGPESGSSYGAMSLPGTISAYLSAFNLTGDPEICLSSSANFILNMSQDIGDDQISRVVWDFGDGTSKVENITTTFYFEESHKYPRRGTYTVIVTPYRALDNTPITEKIAVMQVRVKSCSLPVNHNISVMGYQQ